MGRGNETFGKKEVKAKKEKKRKEKEQRRISRKGQVRDGNNLDEMIAYVDERGNITSVPSDMTNKTEVNADEIILGVPKAQEVEDPQIRKGTVTFFNVSKGFGFIKDSLTLKDIFVHASSLTESVKENSKVTFEIVEGPKGPTASNVKIDRG